MRRQSDNWVNATHILKAAGFDKPARTRILERDVQKGNHEKVQGGYGKFQGNAKSYTVIQTLGHRSSLTRVCAFQEHTFPSQMPANLRANTMSSNVYTLSLTLFPAPSPHLPLRDMPASLNNQRSLLAVSYKPAKA